ncbi:MAG: hypothetical protein CMF52_06350 [Legionellales bacterium]|nr:hypothetical protein [Legionellales bacterium]
MSNSINKPISYSKHIDKTIDSDRLSTHAEAFEKAQIQLHVFDTGIRLTSTKNDISPLVLDLTASKHKRMLTQGPKPPLIRALAIKKDHKEEILIADTTAGFGQDSLCIASHGHPLVSIEKNPLTAAILRILVAQFKAKNGDCQWQVVHECSTSWLENQPNNKVSHSILDPFFDKKHTALPKNDMQWLIKLNMGSDTTNENTLFNTALQKTTQRVIVKRDRRAKPIDLKKPNGSIQLKTTRLDIYQAPPIPGLS